MRFFQFQRDARGQTRRLLVWFALMVALLVLAVNAVLALAWWLTVGGGLGYPRHFFAVNTGLTLLFVLGGWWVETSQLAGGGVRLAERLGARAARPSGSGDEQRLVHVVHELAIAAGMRPPQPMVLAREAAINAFATGWDAEDAAVAVTQGALEHLTREELQGVVAHELSHIREGDTRLNMRLAGMVFGLEMIHRLGQSLAAPNERGQRHVGFLLGLALMGVGWLGWLAGHALQAAVSRQREFLADARAVQWTRNRDGMGRALRKVVGQGTAAPDRLQQPTVQHMLLVSGESGRVARWFDAHPPLAQRIERIYGGRMPALRPSDGRESATPQPFADTQPLALGQPLS
ncbi:M48 family metalloprotease [Aquabacterium sp. A08]|uniref:M48 family metalloprotease n=1 Tax=Aquabacterium sp. A08 TaxID=2718532 RepID=UPI0014245665|nr:M48 family metalloprotease [Aquabacterium sp. A08]NIC42931.1 M48 family metalloprotease [Aquabacterium sp. A08]